MGKVKEPLHLLYRPRSFEEFIGSKQIVESVISVLDRVHVFLFSGPRGCGKTTLARLITEHLEITNIDTHEIDAADKTGVEDARRLKANTHFAPMRGDKKIYIIDECHRLTGNSMDALLKTLEEPPDHVYFVLCTTEPGKVSKTIKSRCACYEVKPLTRRNSRKLVDWICEEEKIEPSDEIKGAIVDRCEGIPREIAVTLDKVRDIDNDRRALELISEADLEKNVIELCVALLDNKKWKEVSAILKGLNDEPEKVRYAVLNYMNSVLLNGGDSREAVIVDEFLDSYMYTGKAGLTLSCWRLSTLKKNNSMDF